MLRYNDSSGKGDRLIYKKGRLRVKPSKIIFEIKRLDAEI